ncbi:SDR family oxidoreductase [Palleronia sp. KMU-117]|uniref:SDR family oxidoreductase n=1 Tax=Palleronia sp. KMU-117 TaxID=3434108 RepID=UPI003D72E861
MPRTVLVTGATGYIAKHIVLQLLERGDRVRGSVRSEKRAGDLRASLQTALSDPTKLHNLSTVTLDLTSDDGWDAAMVDVDAVIHTASPFPLVQPKDENEVIRPAVDGALRALRAAQAAGVRRVVLTSSAVAVITAVRPSNGRAYTEADWSDASSPAATPYAKSKTLAERAAWDFVRDSGGSIDLTCINPTLVVGPPLDLDYGTSIEVIERVLRAKDPMLPNVGFGTVDVRDVATAHVQALDVPESIGQRVLINDRFMWFADMARAVKTALPDRKIVTRVAPDFVVRFLGLFDRSIATIRNDLGKSLSIDTTRARELLGIAFRDTRQSVGETARWLVDKGRV